MMGKLGGESLAGGRAQGQLERASSPIQRHEDTSESRGQNQKWTDYAWWDKEGTVVQADKASQDQLNPGIQSQRIYYTQIPDSATKQGRKKQQLL